MYTEHADRPIITMSMAGTGLNSRLCGEVFGSALTFGAAKKASAPGQAAVNDLNNMLQFLHENQGYRTESLKIKCRKRRRFLVILFLFLNT